MAQNPATFVRLPNTLKSRLASLAKQDQRSLSAFLRVLILEALAYRDGYGAPNTVIVPKRKAR